MIDVTQIVDIPHHYLTWLYVDLLFLFIMIDTIVVAGSIGDQISDVVVDLSPIFDQHLRLLPLWLVQLVVVVEDVDLVDSDEFEIRSFFLFGRKFLSFSALGPGFLYQFLLCHFYHLLPFFVEGLLDVLDQDVTDPNLHLLG
jgi:hypothetical protein